MERKPALNKEDKKMEPREEACQPSQVKKHTVGELIAETEKMVRAQFKGLQKKTLSPTEEEQVKKLARTICLGTLQNMGKL
ncbi:MAG: hypothetical protein NT099_03565 [Candidatus Saganbacteria bacterium]|nr:hypothetical protein [Candidatus Saganbacteria bacterium]